MSVPYALALLFAVTREHAREEAGMPDNGREVSRALMQRVAPLLEHFAFPAELPAAMEFIAIALASFDTAHPLRGSTQNERTRSITWPCPNRQVPATDALAAAAARNTTECHPRTGMVNTLYRSRYARLDDGSGQKVRAGHKIFGIFQRGRQNSATIALGKGFKKSL